MLNVPIANIFETLSDQSRHRLCQRLQRLRPRLPGARPGRPALPRRAGATSTGCACARRPARSCRSARSSRCAERRPGPTSSSATTCTPRCRCRAMPRPASRRARRSTPWSASPREVLPQGTSFEWTELAFQERATGNTAIFIFALSVLFVFLVLAAQYESWSLPLAIILIVPMACCRRSPASCCAGRTTTSSPRSASSCWSASRPRTRS